MQKSFFLKNRERHGSWGEGDEEEEEEEEECIQEREKVKTDSGFVLILSDMFWYLGFKYKLCWAVSHLKGDGVGGEWSHYSAPSS